MTSPKIKTIVLVVASFLIVLGIVFKLMQKSSVVDQPMSCTEEAKICPDGSAVGRVGSKCEFAPCPTVTEVPKNDNTTKAYTYINSKQAIAYMYPRTLATKYIATAAWPPKVWAMGEPFKCKAELAGVDQSNEKIKQKIIGGQEYCVITMEDGAAGSTYKSYSYYSLKNGKFISVQFTLRYPECSNYDDPDKTACETELAFLDVDKLVNGIMDSINFTEPPVILDKLAPGDEIQSPLTITGQAKGGWFFEASFPIILVDSIRKPITQTLARATKEWMTDAFVPFTATLKFNASQTDVGELVFKRDNPSGLPENDAEVRVEVKY